MKRAAGIRNEGVRLSRVVSRPQTNVPRQVTRHSPDGFEWGYGGSGPADLALNILLAWGCEREEADRLYQEFKFDLVATVPFHGGVIEPRVIEHWLARKRGRPFCPDCGEPLDDDALMADAEVCTTCAFAAKLAQWREPAPPKAEELPL